jgi:DNA ligase-1
VKRFVALFQELDSTTKTNVKVAAMARYFLDAPPEDAVWGLYLLTGRRTKRPVNVTKLGQWAQEFAGIPDWLLGECYDAVGDLAETLAKLTIPPFPLQGKACERSELGWGESENSAVPPHLSASFTRRSSPARGGEVPPFPSQGKACEAEPNWEEVTAGNSAQSPHLSPADGSGPPLKGEEKGSLSDWIEHRFLPLRDLPEDQQRATIEEAWRELDEPGRFVWNKLITGSFRVGVSQDLVVRAISQASGNEPASIAHRLMGEWTPSAEFFESLLRTEMGDQDPSHPYPFALAHPLQADPNTLGDPRDWQVEWKFDGIRCQLIRRGGQTFLWSRGEEPIAAKFPEVAALGDHLPDGTVLDGEIMAWRNGPLPFSELQKRIGRKDVGKKLLADVPCALVGFDVLEWRGEDVRRRPLSERREALLECASLLALFPSFAISEEVAAETWAQLAEIRSQSRERRVEGLMLKRLDSPYPVGRKRGQWWKWKIEPHTVDAVLMYAQRGSGIRASLYTDYTFGIWKDGALVPLAKAYSGLDNREIQELDAWIRAHTLEKFGPVRTVEPFHVFELAFEGIQLSKRHKSGLAVRFPRILRWRRDKSADQADTYETVAALL